MEGNSSLFIDPIIQSYFDAFVFLDLMKSFIRCICHRFNELMEFHFFLSRDAFLFTIRIQKVYINPTNSWANGHTRHRDIPVVKVPFNGNNSVFRVVFIQRLQAY